MKKPSKKSSEIEETILLLFAKGMSTMDISGFVEHTYGVPYSKSAISLNADSLLSDISEWQSWSLYDHYAVLWIEAIRYKIRLDGKIKSDDFNASLWKYTKNKKVFQTEMK